ncbi:hypothetical protein [Candidatus Nitrososphaera evergladensis]|nr:hypothetical protein [Candidatus Nitrososphaera evergladensis]
MRREDSLSWSLKVKNWSYAQLAMQDSELLIASTFKVLGDKMACNLLVASASDTGVHPIAAMKKMALTRKQFYSRLARLKKLKLIKKMGENYVPTLQGLLVVNNLLPMMREIIESRWKIDSIDKLMTDKEFTNSHVEEIIDTLLRGSALRKEVLSILQKAE